MKNKIKDTSFAFRIAKDDLSTIRKKAELSNMTVTDFFTKSALNKKIVVIDDLSNITTELKSIGTNINQLTMLANMDRLKIINLSETQQNLISIHKQLSQLSEVLL